MRWRRDDRPAPDERPDHGEDAENWLSEFRGQSVRPEALTAADRDAAGRQAAQVGSRRSGERAEPQPGHEEHRVRPPAGLDREADRSAWQPAPRPGPPRADLERDVGPWAGVRGASDPDSDGWGREAAQRREMAARPGPSEPGRRGWPPADGPDTDEFARLERGGDRPSPDSRRRDPHAAGPGSPAGDRRAASAVRPDRTGHPAGNDGPRAGDGRGEVPAWPDGRPLGPDTRGYQGYDGRRPGGRNQLSRDDFRGRPGYGVEGLARSPAPPPMGGKPAESAPRREPPAERADAGRPGPHRPPQPGSHPPGDVRPDQHARMAGPSGREDAQRDARARPVPGLWRDESPTSVRDPWVRREHEHDGRSAAGFWPAPRDRAPRPGSAPLADRIVPPAAARDVPPAGERALPPAAARPLPPAAAWALPPAAERPLTRGRPRFEPGLRALPEPPRSEPARSEPARSEPPRSEPPRSEPAQPSKATPAQLVSGGRADLPANLSLADLDRVRKALALLSDEPAGVSGETAARDDGPVTSSVAAGPPGALSTERGEDEADTAPLPVILSGATSVPGPVQPEAPRGPFEPARSALSEGAPAAALMDTGVSAPADTAGPASMHTAGPASVHTAIPAPEATSVQAEAEPAGSLSPAAAETLDEIKDLLITAEAIGEANLDRHFERVSQRQRELIREFFERAIPDREPED